MRREERKQRSGPGVWKTIFAVAVAQRNQATPRAKHNGALQKSGLVILSKSSSLIKVYMNESIYYKRCNEKGCPHILIITHCTSKKAGYTLHNSKEHQSYRLKYE